MSRKNKTVDENIYYYFFYVMAVFSRWVNKRDKDYAFKSLAFVSLCLGLNVLSLIFLFIDFRYAKLQVDLVCILLVIVVMGINYYFLFRNGKGRIIVETYDKKYEGSKLIGWKLGLVIFYIVFSLSFCAIVAYLERHHKLTPLALWV